MIYNCKHCGDDINDAEGNHRCCASCKYADIDEDDYPCKGCISIVFSDNCASFCKYNNRVCNDHGGEE